MRSQHVRNSLAGLLLLLTSGSVGCGGPDVGNSDQGTDDPNAPDADPNAPDADPNAPDATPTTQRA